MQKYFAYNKKKTVPPRLLKLPSVCGHCLYLHFVLKGSTSLEACKLTLFDPDLSKKSIKIGLEWDL